MKLHPYYPGKMAMVRLHRAAEAKEPVFTGDPEPEPQTYLGGWGAGLVQTLAPDCPEYRASFRNVAQDADYLRRRSAEMQAQAVKAYQDAALLGAKEPQRLLAPAWSAWEAVIVAGCALVALAAYWFLSHWRF